VKAARAKMQAGDVDGAIADLRQITETTTDSQAPLDVYGTLLEAESRRGSRPEINGTLADLVKRYRSDPRVPFFLLNTAKAAMQNPRPGRVMYALDLAKKILAAYPASPAANEALAIVQQIDSARGRGGPKRGGRPGGDVHSLAGTEATGRNAPGPSSPR
jgi:hypothetical protein